MLASRPQSNLKESSVKSRQQSGFKPKETSKTKSMYPKDGKTDVVDDRRLSFDVDSEPVV